MDGTFFKEDPLLVSTRRVRTVTVNTVQVQPYLMMATLIFWMEVSGLGGTL